MAEEILIGLQGIRQNEVLCQNAQDHPNKEQEQMKCVVTEWRAHIICRPLPRTITLKVLRGKSKLQNSAASRTLKQTITSYKLGPQWVELFKVLVH